MTGRLKTRRLARPVGLVFPHLGRIVAGTDPAIQELLMQPRQRVLVDLQAQARGVPQREGAILERSVFDVVAARLRRDYSWS